MNTQDLYENAQERYERLAVRLGYKISHVRLELEDIEKEIASGWIRNDLPILKMVELIQLAGQLDEALDNVKRERGAK